MKIKEAVAIHGGPLEIHDFHSMEVLESLIEFRAGGERGVASVEFLRADAVWKAAVLRSGSNDFRGQNRETPHLDIAWQPRDFSAVGEMGAAWKIITEDMPEPPWIEPGGPRGE